MNSSCAPCSLQSVIQSGEAAHMWNVIGLRVEGKEMLGLRELLVAQE